ELAGVGWGKITKGVDALKGIKDLDFGDIDGKALGEQLGTAVKDAISGGAGIAAEVGSAVAGMLKKVDWAGIGIEAGKQAPALLLAFAAGLLSDDALMNLIGAIADNWQLVLMGVLTIAFAPGKILAPLVKILGKIPFVGSFLAASVKWLNALGGKATKFGGDLMKTLWKGFTHVPLPGAA